MSDTATARSGNYPIAQREGEIERLRIQAAAMAEDAETMFAHIGVGPGWRCLDLGCGAGGVTDLLSRRVAPKGAVGGAAGGAPAGPAGPIGAVVGLDADPVSLAAARDRAAALGLVATTYMQGDAYATGLPRGSFDLVHIRFLLSTAGQVDDLLTEAVALLRPGGVLALQEPDTDFLNCYPPHPAFDRLKQALQDAFRAAGGDTRLARRLYPMVRAMGLRDVGYRPFLVGVRASDPMVDYLPQTVESVRGTLLDRDLIGAAELDAALAACREHLALPDTVFTTYLVAQIWGRKPEDGEGNS